MPFSKELQLDNIVGFHYSSIGQSHFESLIDTVLGSFRFAVNAFTKSDAGRRESADAILHLLSPLFVRESDGRVAEVSLHFSPLVVKSDKFRKQYEELHGYLAECGIEAVQPVRDQRPY